MCHKVSARLQKLGTAKVIVNTKSKDPNQSKYSVPSFGEVIPLALGRLSCSPSVKPIFPMFCTDLHLSDNCYVLSIGPSSRTVELSNLGRFGWKVICHPMVPHRQGHSESFFLFFSKKWAILSFF